MIGHLYRVGVSLLRAAIKRRSSKWRAIEKAQLAEHPLCEACGANHLLQAHHVLPFHKWPSRELDKNNLITLCMTKSECHLRVGHGGDWDCYNPHVRSDARLFRDADQLDRQVILLGIKKGRRR